VDLIRGCMGLCFKKPNCQRAAIWICCTKPY